MKKILLTLSLFVLCSSFAVAQAVTLPQRKLLPITSGYTINSTFATNNIMPVGNTATATVTATGIPTGITFTWTYTANAPSCYGLTTNCQTGFTLTDTTTGSVLAGPVVLTPFVTTYAYTPAGGLYFGTHSFSLVANGFDATGLPLVSPASLLSITNNVVSLNGPTNLVGSVK